jgi:hypothetical protein
MCTVCNNIQHLLHKLVMLLHFLKQIFIVGQACLLLIKLCPFGTECTNFGSSSSNNRLGQRNLTLNNLQMATQDILFVKSSMLHSHKCLWLLLSISLPVFLYSNHCSSNIRLRTPRLDIQTHDSDRVQNSDFGTRGNEFLIWLSPHLGNNKRWLSSPKVNFLNHWTANSTCSFVSQSSFGWKMYQ